MDNSNEEKNSNKPIRERRPRKLPVAKIFNKQSDKPNNTTSATYGGHVKYVFRENSNPKKERERISPKSIAIAAVIVNIALGLITLMLFNKASTQATAALRADTIANKGYLLTDSTFKSSDSINKATLDATKKYNDSSIALQQAAFKSNNISNKQSFDRASKSLTLQDSSLKESQNEFEISHSPYITVDDFGITPQDSLAIDIQNQGTQIAYGLEREITVKAENITAGDQFKTFKALFNWIPLPKNTPFNFQALIAPTKDIYIFKSLKNISNADLMEVKSGKKTLFIRIVIYYFNTTTKKSMKFEAIYNFFAPTKAIRTYYFNYTKLKKYPEL